MKPVALSLKDEVNSKREKLSKIQNLLHREIKRADTLLTKHEFLKKPAPMSRSASKAVFLAETIAAYGIIANFFV